MSVGHVARSLEERGIATVAVYVAAFEHYARQMRLPRTVVTPYPMGRPLGAPLDHHGQRLVVRTALALLDEATEPGVVVQVGGRYRPVGGEGAARSTPGRDRPPT